MWLLMITMLRAIILGEIRHRLDCCSCRMPDNCAWRWRPQDRCKGCQIHAQPGTATHSRQHHKEALAGPWRANKVGEQNLVGQRNTCSTLHRPLGYLSSVYPDKTTNVTPMPTLRACNKKRRLLGQPTTSSTLVKPKALWPAKNDSALMNRWTSRADHTRGLLHKALKVCGGVWQHAFHVQVHGHGIYCLSCMSDHSGWTYLMLLGPHSNSSCKQPSKC